MNAQITSNKQCQNVMPCAAKAQSRLGRNHPGLLASLGFAALLLASAPASALYPALGNTSTYSILAGASVTNLGLTTINGNVGISPGAALPPNVTGFGPGADQVTFGPGSAVHDVDLSAFNAQADNLILFGDLAGQLCGAPGVFDFTGGGIHELAGASLPPGVYCADSFHITNGLLTLNGTAADTWIFKSASDLVITNGHVASLSCNVWWRVVSSASLDAGSSLIGNTLALTSITLAAGASLSGRAFAQIGNVTLIGNAITGCVAAAGAGASANVPTLSEWAMVMLAALLAIAGFAAMRRQAR